jgi:phage shock protein PspC (stress-responsive transcriptional regulator)
MNRRLVRSRTDRVIGGVAAGLADYMNADTALVRIAWALLIPLTGGAALLAYIVAWIVVPEADASVVGSGTVVSAADVSSDPGMPADPSMPAPVSPSTSPAVRSGGENRAGLVVGIGLVLVGLWFLLREYLPDFDWSLVWPIVLIAVGVLILVGISRRRPEA